MKRRTFIKNGLLSTVGISCLTGLYTWRIEPFWLEFVKIKMPVRHLPPELIGKTLMQISDIHIGNRFDYQYIIDSFKEAQTLNPDFVVYTGDFVSYENEKQFDQLNEVLQYTVRGKFGTVGVLGNHDYGRNWAEQDVADKISSQLEHAGIRMLKNEQAEIGGLNIIGFDDYWALNFNPMKVMESYDEAKASIVLCHNPDVCDLPVWHHYKGWIL